MSDERIYSPDSPPAVVVEHSHEFELGPLTIAGNSCKVHGYHYPEPLRTVRHHVWPKEDGGPTVPANLVDICDTGHYSVHTLLDTLRTGQPLPKGWAPAASASWPRRAGNGSRPRRWSDQITLRDHSWMERRQCGRPT